MPDQSYLNMERSVAKVNDQSHQKLVPQEVDTLVQTPRTNVQAVGDRLRIHDQRFEELSNEIKITQVCESGGFMSTTGACRELSLSRDNTDFELIAWIGGHTRIGPVLQVKGICCLDQFLINTESKNRHRQHPETDQAPHHIQRPKPPRGGIVANKWINE